MKELKITLDAAGSIFEMFPDSNLTDEIRRLNELSSKISRMNAEIMQAQPLVTMRELRLNHALLNADLHALDNDWRNVGGDFLNAYNKTTAGKSRVSGKDETESWSY